MSKRLANILLGMFLFVVCVNYYDSHGERWKTKFGLAPEKPAVEASVGRVISGDTFELSNGTQVHFVGMQAPRYKECMGMEAVGALTELLPEGSKVTSADTRWPDKDQTTLLRHVWLEDGRYLPEVLANSGMLVPYTLNGDAGDEKVRNKRASQMARQTKSGLWGQCDAKMFPI